MTNSNNPDHNDDGRAWGWINDGVWCPIPKLPLLLAQRGPPPFDVTLPGSGEVRHIVHNPNGDDAPAVVAPADEKGISITDTLAVEPSADLFPEDMLPPFHVMRHQGDTDEGWEITSMYVAEALGLPWPVTPQRSGC
jgi:hypothetical protein